MDEYLKILGLSGEVSVSQIKKAYRQMAKMYHPDVNKSPNANELFLLINEAYIYLVNYKSGKYDVPKTRDAQKPDFSYDEWLKKERERAKAKAAYHAKQKYEEFMQSKTYKSAMLINAFSDYIFIALALVMIIVPIMMFVQKGLDPKNPINSIIAMFFSILIGIVMTFFIIRYNKFLWNKIMILSNKCIKYLNNK